MDRLNLFLLPFSIGKTKWLDILDLAMVRLDLSFEVIKSKKKFSRRDIRRVGWSSGGLSLNIHLIYLNQSFQNNNSFFNISDSLISCDHVYHLVVLIWREDPNFDPRNFRPRLRMRLRVKSPGRNPCHPLLVCHPCWRKWQHYK